LDEKGGPPAPLSRNVTARSDCQDDDPKDDDRRGVPPFAKDAKDGAPTSRVRREKVVG